MVEVSNADRVVFPDIGVTKGEVVAYYEQVGERMLVHGGGRPLTLERYPKGLAGKGFMQKNAPDHYPNRIGRYEAPKRDGTTTYAVARTADAFAYLANQGTITFHAWTSTVDHPQRPDRMVIDLDPPEGETAMVGEAARVTRHFLDELAVPTIPLATGSKGYHLVAPILPTLPYEQVERFARGSAALLALAAPDLMTVEFRIERRQGRVFVDWLRNRWSSTGVVPWSLRARRGAPAAVPIEWSELAATRPDRWTIRSAADLLSEPDPLVELAGRPTDLAGAAAAVAGRLAAQGIELDEFDRFRS